MKTGTLKKFEHPFTITPNAIVNDTRLSAADKGVALVICSKPNGWVFHTAEIVKACGGGTYVVKGSLTKLEQLGYISRVRAKDNTGRFVGISIEIHEKPVKQAASDGIEGSIADDCDSEENPRIEKTHCGPVDPYSNTDLSSNTNLIEKTTPIPPQGGVLALSVEPIGSPSEPADRFEDFWKSYPKCERKIGKAKCREMWTKRNLNAYADAIIKVLAVDAKSHDWCKESGRFIPMPQTWLNRKRWEDIPSPSPKSAAPSLLAGSWAVFTAADADRELEFVSWASGDRKSPPPPWSVHTDEWVQQNRENIIKGIRI